MVCTFCLAPGAVWTTITPNAITRVVQQGETDVYAGTNLNTDYVYYTIDNTTVILPDATMIGTNMYTITNTDGSTVMVETTGSQTINGSPSITMSIENQSRDFISNGSNWIIV